MCPLLSSLKTLLGMQGLNMQGSFVPLLALAHFADGSWEDISGRPGLSITSATPTVLQAQKNGSSWQVGS